MLEYVKELNYYFEYEATDVSVQDNNARKRLYLDDTTWSSKPLLDFIKSIKPVDANNYMIKIDESSKQKVSPPHSDWFKGLYTCVIPLRWYDDVYTIEYHQSYTGDNAGGYKYRPSGNTYYENEWLSNDTEKIIGLTNKEFDKDFYEKYLIKSVDYEDLYGLTVNKIHKWTMGKPIVFPCEVLHSGSAFQIVKRWLVCHW